jgi:transposase
LTRVWERARQERGRGSGRAPEPGGGDGAVDMSGDGAPGGTDVGGRGDRLVAGGQRVQHLVVHPAVDQGEVLLPGLSCPCCGTVTFAEPPPGLHAGAVSCGPVLNAAAVLLSGYGNVPAERAAQLIGMLLGTEVSPGWVGKAAARVNAQLTAAGFDEAMIAALLAEDVLAADETPVNVLDKTPPAPEKEEKDPEENDGKSPAGAPHVLIIRAPDGRLTSLLALGSRRKGSAGGGIPAAFTGYLMTGGYTGCQHLLSRIAGIQQCCAHVIRRARAVQKPGPGGVQNWAADIIKVLGQAHRAVEEARARGSTALDPQALDDLLERYDTAVRPGMIHNRLRDWDTGNHPGYSLACWLQEYKEQVFLFTRDFAVDWTTNVAERGAKAAKRHQAVSGYWQSLPTLARWCRLRSYLDSAAAHGITALDAMDHPGNLGGSDSWEDAGPWQHRRGTQTSCVSAR